MKLIAAFTEATYPRDSTCGYINISWAGSHPHSSEPDDTNIVITVRKRGGDSESITMQRHEFNQLIVEFLKEEKVTLSSIEENARNVFADELRRRLKRGGDSYVHKQIYSALYDGRYK